MVILPLLSDNPIYFDDPDGMMPRPNARERARRRAKARESGNTLGSAIISGLTNFFTTLSIAGNHVERVGSGFTNGGSSEGNRGNNTISNNPDDDIDLQGTVANGIAFSKVGSKSAKTGKGRNTATKKGENSASNFKKGFSKMKKIEGKVNAVGKTASLLNGDTTDSSITKSTVATRFNTDITSKTADSTKTEVKFTGTESEVNRQVDSTNRNSQQQREFSKMLLDN